MVQLLWKTFLVVLQRVKHRVNIWPGNCTLRQIPKRSENKFSKICTQMFRAVLSTIAKKWKVKVKSLSCVWLLATPWTTAYQAPLSTGFSRQEYWSGVPSPSPRQRAVCAYLLISIDLQQGTEHSCGRQPWKMFPHEPYLLEITLLHNLIPRSVGCT